MLNLDPVRFIGWFVCRSICWLRVTVSMVVDVGGRRVTSPRTLAAVQGLIGLSEVIVKHWNIVLYCVSDNVPVVMQFKNLQANNQTADQIKPLWPPIRSWERIKVKYGGMKNVTGNNCYVSASLQVIFNIIEWSTCYFLSYPVQSATHIYLIGKGPWSKQLIGLY